MSTSPPRAAAVPDPNAPPPVHPQDLSPPEDPVEAVTRHIPMVIPLAGAILIFLLAFIAVKMA